MRIPLLSTVLVLLSALVLYPVTPVQAQQDDAGSRLTAMLQQKKFAEARDLIEQELQREDLQQDLQPNLLFQLAYCMSELKEYRSSINTYHRMMGLVGGHPLIWGNLGWAYYLDGNLDSAIIATRHAITLDGTMGWLWGNMGLYKLASGDTDGMRNSYAKAAELTEDDDTWSAIQGDLDTYCAEKQDSNCEEAQAALHSGRMSMLRRWYSESDAEKGRALVAAHQDEYREVSDMLGEEIETADAGNKEALAALQKRLAADLK
jgi:tetratricopeptide (TPR) repeat protein